MKKFVGNYHLGMRNVRLYAALDTGNGSVDLIPDDKGTTIISVGIDGPFYEAVSVLLHEVYEATLIDLNTRYKTQPSYSDESSDFIFIASHNQLSEAHERVGTFVSLAYNDFEKAYEKWSRYISRRKKK